MSSTKTRWTFACRAHQEYGSLGWILDNMPAFDPLGGMAVAHDVMEHIPHDDSTTGELMALGAMMYVRGGDYFANKRSMTPRPSYHASGEVGDLFCKIHTGEWVPLRDAPKLYKAREIQSEIDNLVFLVRKHLKEERDNDYKLTAADNRNLRAWIAYGYNRAVIRYKNITRLELLDVFCEIEEYADERLKTAEEGITKLYVSLKWEPDRITKDRNAKLKVWSTEEYR